MTRNKKPKPLRQIEDCINCCSFYVNDAGELVMIHAEGFTKSEIELLKVYFKKQSDPRKQDG